ncbi:MmcQ/YjbR family DNA-binding protein [Paenibacillus sp. JCM 10914]|uniref:MmcQ/YjbR family DNA-binding protein n=1 Tax=Paenibacillus sp. JCM 10914 TaxID=1236974 RepID=UPI0003CC5983|nr:MmcQ/YjbR family DNA-binding protein [Paenibacillus sp. JCM 10914]GAE09158.1 hypothetical cytosolic protein [Paenibacillus sp. JCM 10914]
MLTHTIFKNKKPNYNRLEKYGFHKKNDIYTYTTLIAEQQFQLTVLITDDGIVDTKVIDSQSGDEYVLHRTDVAIGSFIGKVREAHDDVLNKIAESCYETDVFKSDYAHRVISYVEKTYGDELEFLWQRFPNNAIWRRKDTNKWYAALLVLAKRKLGMDSDDIIDIINLRILPEDIETIVDKQGYFPGFHMNKKHWCTICLDGSVPIEEVWQRIDESYRLATK